MNAVSDSAMHRDGISRPVTLLRRELESLHAQRLATTSSASWPPSASARRSAPSPTPWTARRAWTATPGRRCAAPAPGFRAVHQLGHERAFTRRPFMFYVAHVSPQPRLRRRHAHGAVRASAASVLCRAVMPHRARHDIRVYACPQLRRKYNLPTTFGLPPGCDDCCVHFFCMYCASHQAREQRDAQCHVLFGP